jgi:two-component system NtrC family sensor kinase
MTATRTRLPISRQRRRRSGADSPPFQAVGLQTPAGNFNMRSRWWTRLSVQATAVITVATALGGLIFVWLVLRSQQQLLMDQTVRNAAFFSDTLLNSLEREMLRNERAELMAALTAVATQPSMRELRLFDHKGVTAFSSRPGEAGRTADMKEQTCVACHGTAQRPAVLNAKERSRIVPNHRGRMLATVTPIYNRTECATSGCHAPPDRQRVLGLLEVGVSLNDVDDTLLALQRTTAAAGLLTIVGLAVVAIAFTRRQVVRPIAKLAEGVNRVKLGELKEPVEVEGSGEVADLALAFNEMEAALLDIRRQRQALLENLEKQVRERTAALEKAQERMVHTEKMSSLGRLAASIAHEINNPLAGILTYAKLLVRTLEAWGPDDATRQKLVKNLKLVEQETRRCTAIVRGLLDFARERPLETTDFDLNAAVAEALGLIRHQIELQNITLEVESGALPPVHADFGQIRQCLLNVLINGCDAMPGGGTLRVTTRAGEGVVEARIQDTGVGIPPENLKRVFDPFFTTKTKGTGLGLSVVYGIVEGHGGSLRLESTVGAGTSVTLVLPAEAKHAEAECPSASPGLAKAPGQTG